MSVGTFTITLAASPYGTYDPAYNVEGTYELPADGSVFAFRIVPNTGYTFLKWVQETDYGRNGTWDALKNLSTSQLVNWTSSTANIAFRVTPIFEVAGMKNLTILSRTGGVTSPTMGVYSYADGTIIDVTAIPGEGYELSHWLLNGLKVGSVNPISVTMNIHNDLQPIFVAVTATYTLVLHGSPYCTYDGAYGLTEGTHEVPIDENQLIRVIPNSGYVFQKWILETDVNQDGVIDSTTDPYATTEAISFSSGTTTITFHLTPVLVGTTTVSLTVLSPLGEGSTDPPPGTYDYYEGETAVLNAYPHTGHSFTVWLVDGNQYTDNPLSLLMDADHTIQAVFTAGVNAYNVSINSDPQGIVFNISKVV